MFNVQHFVVGFNICNEFYVFYELSLVFMLCCFMFNVQHFVVGLNICNEFYVCAFFVHDLHRPVRLQPKGRRWQLQTPAQRLNVCRRKRM